jgi:hypothetical protein
VRVVSNIKSAVSVDLVTEAGAGGAIKAMIESKKEASQGPIKTKWSLQELTKLFKTKSKEGGPGSGRKPSGRVIGKTKSGKEIHSNSHISHPMDFSSQDHTDAADAHNSRANALLFDKENPRGTSNAQFKSYARARDYHRDAAKVLAPYEKKIEALEGGPGSGRHKGGGGSKKQTTHAHHGKVRYFDKSSGQGIISGNDGTQHQISLDLNHPEDNAVAQKLSSGKSISFNQVFPGDKEDTTAYLDKNTIIK